MTDANQNTHDAHRASLAQVVVQLSTTAPPLGPVDFLALMHRRKVIVRYMHAVLARCQADSGEAEPRALAPAAQSSPFDSDPSDDDQLVQISPTLRIVVLSLFPLIRSLSRSDPDLKAHVLSVLLRVLHTLPCLSLRDEPGDCLDSYRDLVQGLSAAQAGRSAQEQGAAVSALLGMALHEGRLRHILSAVETMLRLSLPVPAKPSPAAALATSAVLSRTRSSKKRKKGASDQEAELFVAPAALPPVPIHLDVGPFLQQLAAFPSTRDVPALDADSLLCVWQHHSPDLCSKINHSFSTAKRDSHHSHRHIPQDPAAAELAAPPSSVASDGFFLYLLTKGGLAKVGSGYRGTIRGHVYARNSDFFAADASAAASSANASPPAQLEADAGGALVMVSNRLLLVKVASGSTGRGGTSVREIDKLTLVATQPVAVQHALGQLVGPYLSVTAQQDCIYCLWHPQQQAAQVGCLPNQVDVYKLAGHTLSFARSFTLADSPSKTPAALPRAASAAPKRASWLTICTGEQGHIIRICCPSKNQSAPAAYAGRGSSAKIIQHTFSCRTGAMCPSSAPSATHHLPRPASPGSSVCYDGPNDVIWGYTADSTTLRCWRNSGPSPSPDYLARQHAREPTFVIPAPAPACEAAPCTAAPAKRARTSRSLVAVEPDAAAAAAAAADAQSTLTLPSAAATMYHISRLTRPYAPGKDSVWTDYRPMCVDACPETFQHLQAILTTCQSFLTPPSQPASSPGSPAATVAAVRTVLCATLPVLRLNLQYATGTQLRLSPALCQGLKAVLTRLERWASPADEGFAEHVRWQALDALMSGACYFFPQPRDLQGLLQGPLQHHQLVTRHLLQNGAIESLASPEFLPAVLTGLLQQAFSPSVSAPLAAPLAHQPLPPPAQVHPVMSQPLQLLLRLQRHVLAGLSSQDPPRRTVLITFCATVLASATRALHPPRSTSPTSELLSSPLAVLVPAMVNALNQNHLRCPRLDQSLLLSDGALQSGPLVSLLRATDLCNQLNRAEVRATERALQDRLASDSHVEGRSVSIESTHPYDNNRFSRKVIVEGTNFLMLVFDPRCCSVGRDSLVLTGKDGKALPGLPASLGGSSKHWPAGPIVVHGDRCTFTWTPDGYRGGRKATDSKARWGFRCTVKGCRPAAPLALPWMLDLELSLARLAGKCVQSLLLRSNRRQPGTGSPGLLESPLFAQGRRAAASSSTAERVLQSLVKGTAHGIRLLELLMKCVRGGSAMSKEAKLGMPRPQRALFAVLLLQMGLLDQAVALNTSLGRTTFAKEGPAPALVKATKARPEFAALSAAVQSLYRMEPRLLQMCRLQKGWQDSTGDPSAAEAFLRDLSGADRALLCALQGIAAREPKAVATRLRAALGTVILHHTGTNTLGVEPTTERKAGPEAGLTWKDAYKRVGDHIVERAQFLLSLQPAQPQEAAAAAPTRAVPEGRAQPGAQPALATPVSWFLTREDRRQLDDEEQRGQLCFRRSAERAPPGAASSSAQDPVRTAIMSFLTHAEPPASFEQALEDSRQLGLARVQGLRVLAEIIGATSFGSVQHALLSGLGSNLRQAWACDHGGPHYLHQLQSCGPALQEQVRQAWFGLAQQLLAKVAAAGGHTSTKLLALDVLALCYRASDTTQLQQCRLFEILQQLMLDAATSPKLRASARSTFCMLSTVCLWWPAEHLPRVRSFQTGLFRMLLQLLGVEIARMCRSPPAALPRKVEAAATSSQPHQWQWMDDRGHWRSYDARDTSTLNKAQTTATERVQLPPLPLSDFSLNKP